MQRMLDGPHRVTPDLPLGPSAVWTVFWGGVAHIRSEEYVGGWLGRFASGVV